MICLVFEAHIKSPQVKYVVNIELEEMLDSNLKSRLLKLAHVSCHFLPDARLQFVFVDVAMISGGIAR